MNISVLSALLALGLLASVSFAEEFDCEKNVKKQQNVIGSLTRQLMMLQLNAEESARTGGDSGIKQTRHRNIGTKVYHSSTHISNAVNSNHDHSQNKLTVGMGEVVAVINGVEFRTRHNDYAMMMPSTTSGASGAIQQLDLPEVPPAVLAQPTVDGQIKEMREWFKAFKGQRGKHRANPDKRDYWNYFKPVLCYMEGGWTQAAEAIDEPFESDRHFVDASTWWDLTEKVRYTGNSGTKSTKENYSFLPMKIFNLNKYGDPVFAQWNYRILCAPLKNDVPTVNLRVIDDLSNRMKNGKTLKEHETSRRARFEVYSWRNPDQHSWERSYRKSILDDLMQQIPGKDNYMANLTDNSFGNIAQSYGKLDTPVNAGYYHRIYRGEKGAMGSTTRNRGFSDRNIFMAKTTQAKVPSMKVTDCYGGPCVDYESKWSYAIPLEIIYLTPLYNWNPFNLTYAENKRGKMAKLYNQVTANGRNGGLTKETAYHGSRRNVYYRTPEALFGSGGEIDRDPADTSKGTVGVLDQDGNIQKAVASGTRIMLPDIPGVGKVRTRYPISPLFNDGSQIYKEVEALKDIVLRQDTYSKMLYEIVQGPSGNNGLKPDNTMVTLSMTMTHRDPPGLHTHTVEIHSSDLKALMTTGETLEIDTSESNSHSHVLEIRYDGAATHPWEIRACDGGDQCWDGHQMFLVRVD